ncbi:BPTI/Kunitz domain-containing protein [uncultured Thiodictyon sp.]|uniref:BPTI/Kunitz domain-containing protein n=1 Tax=uncultured Thiodictyon sp. TaxID=1846217 RepID=UPI0025F768B1|nr:BPTI/Kunitz domain-containing protein [uncultured Thiodictyon sp.]
MRVVWRCWVLVALVSVGGCGGGGDGPLRVSNPEDLPVSCVAKPAAGSCHGHYRKFYYDYRNNRCKAFSYSGCGGRVPFETLEDCLNYCGATP